MYLKSVWDNTRQVCVKTVTANRAIKVTLARSLAKQSKEHQCLFFVCFSFNTIYAVNPVNIFLNTRQTIIVI